MTIEVKQLVIKSSVNGDEDTPRQSVESSVDLASFKKELLAECREIVSESLSSLRDR
ncbi:MAG: DUF5908 family protein [Pseudomonadales bacterium]|jgi:hypothetical protein